MTLRSHVSSNRRSRRARRAGYTLVEVMMAIAVMTAGALAVMALHQVTTFGNMQSRQLTTATQAAQTWVERLQRDSINWTTGGPTADRSLGGLNTALARTTYLRSVARPGAAATWSVPAPALATESWAFDHFGRDTRIAADMRFCTNVRLQWVYPAQAMRADVRVWYMRSHTGIDVTPFVGCAAGTDPNTLTAQLQSLSFVYTSTVLRWTPLPI